MVLLQNKNRRNSIVIIIEHYSQQALQSEDGSQRLLSSLKANRAPERWRATLPRPESLSRGKSEPVPLGLEPRRQHSVPQFLRSARGHQLRSETHPVGARSTRKEVGAKQFQDRRAARLPTSEAALLSITSFNHMSSSSDSSALRLEQNMGTCCLYQKTNHTKPRIRPCPCSAEMLTRTP